MNNKALSIVVPVYNVEAFLPKCIDSLLNQDIDSAEYEIILIDDGSSDSCHGICDMYTEIHDNIKVIHQGNEGLSAARNTGIDVAQGKYIQFVDSDDFLCPNVLGGIVLQLEEQNLDILRINYQNVDISGEEFEPNRYSKPFDDYSKEVCDGLTFLNERLGFACYAVQFITKASLVKQEGNGFKQGVFFEDTEWAPRIILQAKRIASTPSITYNYTYRNNSISRNSDIEKKRKSIEDKFCLVEALKMQGTNVIDPRWFNGMIAQTVLSILSDVGRYFFCDRKQHIQRLRQLKVIPLSPYHSTASAAKKIWLANTFPELLCRFIHFKNCR